jgi:hypothetical protein
MNTLTSRGEHGGARLKFLVVIAIIALVAYTGYLFIPVAYQAFRFKDLMQNEVDAAVAMGRSPSWVKEQLVKSSSEYGIPADAIITPTQEDNRMVVRVQYTQPIEFPGYVYNYEFDHTAKSATFLSVK